MSTVSIWTRSVRAQSNLPAYRFVTPLGELGGNSGILMSAISEGDVAPIITLGEAKVELASEQSVINIGDKVIGNELGLAVLSPEGLTVLAIDGNKIKVLVR